IQLCEVLTMRKHLCLIGTAAAILAMAAGGNFVARADKPLVLAATSADTVVATNLIGRTVVDSKGATLGKIDGVLVDAAGMVKYVIVGVGGFLGIGEKDVALRWDQLNSQSGDKLIADLTKEQLTSMPGYRYTDVKRRGTVYSYDEGLAANPIL